MPFLRNREVVVFNFIFRLFSVVYLFIVVFEVLFFILIQSNLSPVLLFNGIFLLKLLIITQGRSPLFFFTSLPKILPVRF